jgi:hypothetical protein
MITETCKVHPIIENKLSIIEESLNRIDLHTQKIVVGMYGSIDSPGSGFIHEVKNDRDFTHGKIDDFEKAIYEIKRLFNGSIAAIVGGIVTIATAAVVAAVNGWIK